MDSLCEIRLEEERNHSVSTEDRLEAYQKEQALDPAILKGLKGLLIDLDGVVHVGSQLTPGLGDFLDFIERHKIKIIYVTNNSTITTKKLGDHLTELGVKVNSDQILTSATATLFYLKETLPLNARVYIVGEEGLKDTIEGAGFIYDEKEADAVIVGLDRGINYEKIQQAASLIWGGAKFIACNADSGAPKPEGIAPGAGAMVGAIQAVTDVQPVIIGKPEPAIFTEGVRQLGLRKEECAAIGDRLDIDILCANRAGILGILVLTGMTSFDDLKSSSIRPGLVFPTLAELVTTWEGILQRL